MKYVAATEDHTFTIEIGRPGEVTVNDTARHVDLQPIDDTLFSLIVDGRAYEAFVERREGAYHVMIEGERHVVEIEDERRGGLRRLGEAKHDHAGEVQVNAPMPGLVVAVSVEAGQAVRAGQGVAVLEAMKMENEIRSPRDGTVKTVRVKAGEKVNQGTVLVVIG